ncbi:CopD family protein [Acuticoccus kandeliae]|uniref:CopD family protein n=1 Tax=Acuticoccus kandeliae TaxID=2073160 RepID=UPI000D3E72B6|nr:CopD family protein [Acuticoccus kandeliae]
MSDIDGFALFGILVRALGYAAGLLCVGSGLFLAAFGRWAFPESNAAEMRRVMDRTAWVGGIAAIVAAAATLAGVCVRAGHLSGLDLAGMTDAMMLEIVLDGPVGTAVAVRVAGLAVALVGLCLFRRGVGRALSLAGAITYALSYAFAGHATEEPRWLLSIVLTVHLAAIGFWFGSLAPLAMIARRASLLDAAAILDAFGRAAVWIVAALVTAGAIFAAFLVRDPTGLIESPYGRLLVLKLGIVTAVLALAALNKLRLVPSLNRGEPAARDHLVRSIRLEALAIILVFATTAFLTSMATPPARIAATSARSSWPCACPNRSLRTDSVSPTRRELTV